MPRITTHLHAALKLSERLEVKDLDAFYLGNVYPLCDEQTFMETKEMNDFKLGCLFQLWLDNYIMNVNMEDISIYDCMICDMEVILPLILELKKKVFEGKEGQAMEKILALESEPMPLYLVPEHKKEKYIKILDEAIETFVATEALRCWSSGRKEFKILITGASGFLGSRIAQYYKDKYEVITPSHSDMDITDEQSVKDYFKLTTPDIVVHCAAMSNVAECERNPEKSWAVNVIGTENIVKCAKEIHAKCICCSSDQVYCAVKTRGPNLEDTPVQPTNVYGKEKAYAEKSCLAICEDSIHLRLSWMYDANDEKRMDFVKQVKACHAKTSDIQFSMMDYRGITDVWEVVRNIELIFRAPGGVYNFGSPNDKSMFDTVAKIFEGKAYDISLVHKLENASFRNLTMSQEKINQYGICFSDTVKGVLREW